MTKSDQIPILTCELYWRPEFKLHKGVSRLRAAELNTKQPKILGSKS